MSSRASGQATSRDAQRERLRKQRQAELKRQRNIRRAVIAVVTILALLLVGGIGYGIWKATAGKDDPRAKVIETTKLDPKAVSYTHLTLPTILRSCRSRWSPYH